MPTAQDAPFLVLTAIMDASARPAAVTRTHGDAMERALNAIATLRIAGLEIVELPIAPQAFAALRTHMGWPEQAVALYDIFPLSCQLEAHVRHLAGQFLAAEALWTLEEQGMLGGVPLNIKLEVPAGWPKAPKELHARLVEAGALEISTEGVATFKEVKRTWDASAPTQSATA